MSECTGPVRTASPIHASPASAGNESELYAARLARRAQRSVLVGQAAFLLTAALSVYFFVASNWLTRVPFLLPIIIGFFLLAAGSASASIAAIGLALSGRNRANTFNRSLANSGLFLGLFSLLATMSILVFSLQFWSPLVPFLY